MCVCMYVCMYVCECLYMYVCECVYVCVCMCANTMVLAACMSVLGHGTSCDELWSEDPLGHEDSLWL